MHEANHTRRRSTARGERRVLRAAIAMGATVAVGVGAAPAAHAAPAVPSPPVASVTPRIDSVTDPSADAAAVELLKATYFNDVDTKNWLALRELFTPDAVVDTTGSFGPYFPNRDSFIAFTSLTLSAINTRHQGYDPQIDLTSDTTATAEWTMQDRLSIAGLVTIHGYGHYTDNYEELDGKWLITYSKLTRTGFTLEFPAIQDFSNGLANAYRSGGAVAALVYVVPGIVNIPINAVKSLVGAIASNFGGPATKAQPITVPPGSTGVTTEPPGIPSTAPAAGSSSVRAQTLSTSAAAANRSSDRRIKPLAANVADPAVEPAPRSRSGATRPAGTGEPQARSTITTPQALENHAQPFGLLGSAKSTTTPTNVGEGYKQSASSHSEGSTTPTSPSSTINRTTNPARSSHGNDSAKPSSKSTDTTK